MQHSGSWVEPPGVQVAVLSSKGVRKQNLRRVGGYTTYPTRVVLVRVVRVFVAVTVVVVVDWVLGTRTSRGGGSHLSVRQVRKIG